MIEKIHITCNDRVDWKDNFDVSSHELSPFLITIIRTMANADILYMDARPRIKNKSLKGYWGLYGMNIIISTFNCLF